MGIGKKWWCHYAALYTATVLLSVVLHYLFCEIGSVSKLFYGDWLKNKIVYE